MKVTDEAAPNERLRAMFDAAMDFGLSDEEAWEAAKELAARTPADKPVAECLDESRRSLPTESTGGSDGLDE